METRVEYSGKGEVQILHLTEVDLTWEGRRKPFEQITLKDFNLSLTDAVRATFVFFIDGRHRRGWKKMLGFLKDTGNKVKLLKAS